MSFFEEQRKMMERNSKRFKAYKDDKKLKNSGDKKR